MGARAKLDRAKTKKKKEGRGRVGRAQEEPVRLYLMERFWYITAPGIPSARSILIVFVSTCRARDMRH